MGLNTDDLAEQRTNWAEDRTLLANERTFASWLRAGLTAVAVGMGFQALFKTVEPTWIAKAIASVFIGIGIIMFVSAFHNACRMMRRMHSHTARPVPRRNLMVITTLFVAGSMGLAVVLWFL